MAEGTRFKDVLEAQKQMDQLLQSEGLRRDAAEARMQEQITDMGLGMDAKMQGNSHGWSGIRPLVVDPRAKSTESISRDHVVCGDLPSLQSPVESGSMAEDAVDTAIKSGKIEPSKQVHDLQPTPYWC